MPRLGLEFAAASASLEPDLFCNVLSPPKLDHLIVRKQAAVDLAHASPVGLLKRKADGRVLAEAMQGFMVNILVFFISHEIYMSANRILVPARNQNWEFCQDDSRILKTHFGQYNPKFAFI